MEGVSEDCHFEAPDARATPVGESHNFDLTMLDGSDRVKVVAEPVEDVLECRNGLAGQNDGLRKQTVAHRVLRDDGFALGSDRTGGRGSGGLFAFGCFGAAGLCAVGTR